MYGTTLAGAIRILFLYDVCESIDLEKLRTLIASEPRDDATQRQRSAAPYQYAPEYVRFERPPLVQKLGGITFKSQHQFEAEVNYYEYGAVSLKLELPFEVGWPELVVLSSQWIADPGLEAEAMNVISRSLKPARAAMIRPNREWLSEDYYIVHVNSSPIPQVASPGGVDLIREHGSEIARIVRGEQANLSEDEIREILNSRMSYYPNDLLVVGWTAAFVWDTSEGAALTLQLLEYANTQLLEFRYYDGVLTRVLERVYTSLDKRGGLFGRWRLAREAENLNKIRLDVRELTERIDTSIKFLSDMFSSRQYRVAASKIGVDDYRNLVESKLRTAGDLYTSMMDQFHASRGFVLELLVVVILIVELVIIFRDRF